MATQALSNLTALQQLFAPTAQAIGGLNGAQLAIAQEQYNRAKQLENLQREQAFVRERDATATNRSIQLANLSEDRQDKRLKASEDKELARERSRLKAAIRSVYSEYKQKGGEKKIEELGDIASDDIAILGDLAAALSDEMGVVQLGIEKNVVNELNNQRLQAQERIKAESTLTAEELDSAATRAAEAITDETQRANFYKALQKMKPLEAANRLNPKAQQELQLGIRGARDVMLAEKRKGEPLKAALRSLQEIETTMGQTLARNPRLREMFAAKPLQSLPQPGMAPDPKDGANALGLGGTAPATPVSAGTSLPNLYRSIGSQSPASALSIQQDSLMTPNMDLSTLSVQPSTFQPPVPKPVTPAPQQVPQFITVPQRQPLPNLARPTYPLNPGP